MNSTRQFPQQGRPHWAHAPAAGTPGWLAHSTWGGMVSIGCLLPLLPVDPRGDGVRLRWGGGELQTVLAVQPVRLFYPVNVQTAPVVVEEERLRGGERG